MTDQVGAGPMHTIRGGIVLCENCQPMLNGKWLIVGTYSGFNVIGDVWLSPPLQCYVRVQVEQMGDFPANVKLINRALPSNHAPLYDMNFTMQVRDPLQLIELGCQLPPLEVRSPCRISDMRQGHAYGVSLLLWLRVGGIDLASSPLNVIFRPPPQGGLSHAGADHPGRPPMDPA